MRKLLSVHGSAAVTLGPVVAAATAPDRPLHDVQFAANRPSSIYC
ncbi:hypothetical protein [Novosphingobium endophyticum]|nr:hypothetical protein [Novosphingobium endophyticum]